MDSHDVISPRTRSFRKGTLIFSAFLILSISENVLVTEIPVLGIKDLPPQLVFVANLLALLYLFLSFLIYYLQDVTNKNQSSKELQLNNDSNKSIKEYNYRMVKLIDDFFEDENDHTKKAKERLLRSLMKTQISEFHMRYSIKKIFSALNKRLNTTYNYDNFHRAINHDRANHIEGLENRSKSILKIVIIDRFVAAWDFWLPLLATMAALSVYFYMNTQ